MLIYALLAAYALATGLVLDWRHGSSVQKIVGLLLLVLLVFFASLRSESVGRDTYQFCIAFQVALDPSYWPSYTRDLEPGFVLLCKVIGIYTNSSQALIAVSSIVSLGAVGFFVYRESENMAVSIFAFIALNLYAFFLNGMRQAIAIGVFLIFFEISRRSGRKFLVWLGVLFAATFHLSALVFAIAVIAERGFIGERWWKWLLGGAVACAVFPGLAVWLLSITPYGVYVEASYLNEFIGSNYFGALLQALLAVYLLILTCRLNDDGGSVISGSFRASEKELSNHFLQTMALLSATLSVASMGVALFSRVQVYFLFFSVIAIPKIINQSREQLGGFAVRDVTLILVLSGFWIVTTLLRPEWYEVVPYNFFF